MANLNLPCNVPSTIIPPVLKGKKTHRLLVQEIIDSHQQRLISFALKQEPSVK